MGTLATQLIMPQMGYDMEEGTLLRWLKAEGDQVQRGEPVAEIETDKAVVEIEAIATGVLRKMLVEEGVTVPVGSPIGIVAGEDEDITGYDSEVSHGTAERKQPSSRETEPAISSDTSGGTPSAPVTADSVKASPVARRIARELGVDLGQVHGSGPGGRIVREDVESHAAARPEASESDDGAPADKSPSLAAPSSPTRLPMESQRVELTRMRQAIARSTSQSKQGTPHFYVTTEVDMTDAVSLRAKFNETLGEGIRVTINDVILRGVVIALNQYPRLNSSYHDGYIDIYPYINLGVAIARDQGLMVPAIVNAQDKSLVELAVACKDLIERAQGGHLRQEEYNGTFSTSNLGMFGVDDFSAIILPPQAAVLAIGAVKKQPVVLNDQIVVRQMMKTTVSVDHRVSDGMEGAQFLQELKAVLENPIRLLL